jgi:hypothetical protein
VLTFAVSSCTVPSAGISACRKAFRSCSSNVLKQRLQVSAILVMVAEISLNCLFVSDWRGRVRIEHALKSNAYIE